jgi:hypothetical protein
LGREKGLVRGWGKTRGKQRDEYIHYIHV